MPKKPSWKITNYLNLPTKEYVTVMTGEAMVESLLVVLGGQDNSFSGIHRFEVDTVPTFKIVHKKGVLGTMYTRYKIDTKKFADMHFDASVQEVQYNGTFDIIKTLHHNGVEIDPPTPPGQRLTAHSLVDILKVYMQDPDADYYYHGTEGLVELSQNAFVAMVCWIGSESGGKTPEGLLYTGILTLLRNGLAISNTRLSDIITEHYLKLLSEKILKGAEG